jgi:hypothetical protein
VKIPTENLTWYQEIDLVNKLITGLIPGDYEDNGEVLEVLYITDNLLRLTPEERIKTAIKLLKQIQKDYFPQTD